MLARRLPGILPMLSFEEALEATMVYSVAGMLAGRALVAERPFRAPHHTVSVAGLVGGGPAVRPGEISLAHTGVLFLDELLEFARPALEALRQPLEERSIAVVRARKTVLFPADFMLVAALMGLDVMKAVYAHAIARGYRFYSYGDASLLMPGGDRSFASKTDR